MFEYTSHINGSSFFIPSISRIVGGILVINDVGLLLEALFTSTIVFSSSYSVFNDDKGAAESNKNERFKMWLRLTGICLLLIFFATIAAMLICVLIEHTA